MTQEDASAPNTALGPMKFDASGLVPVVAQDETTGDVVLLAYMNQEALRRTLAEGVLGLWEPVTGPDLVQRRTVRPHTTGERTARKLRGDSSAGAGTIR